MIKSAISLQDLRRGIYIKAKAESAWRFWELYVHVCKMETLQRAYKVAKQNNGAPGIDGVTFEAIEQAGLEGFLQQIRQELVNLTYRPTRNQKKEIPKSNGKSRTLGIPTIKDRVVQGALKTSSTVRAEKTVKKVGAIRRCCIMSKMSSGGVAGQGYLGNLRLLKRSIRKWNTEHWAKQA
ncbi:MAG: hypothetical protein H8D56_05770 [Planctomycetes bacterium]|nr:hypothetical protein [Planctomycetota bacterium]MBL7145435.1 hypothetical protein [Phycisphaerae bacterium]